MIDHLVIVVADHNPKSRERRCRLLAREDVCIHETGRGSEALELVARHKPDAVILDTELKEPDGIEVLARLKSQPSSFSPVILSIPASASAAHRRAAFACGADAYLVDPIEPELLIATVRGVLTMGRRLRQVEHEAAASAKRLFDARAEIEQFAAHACHDIEEPLRGVATFVQLIEERREGHLTEHERTYLGHVLAAGARVRRLLRGYLSYSQAGVSRRTQFGPLDLRAAAGAAVQSLRKRVEESGATLTFQEKWPVVWGDFGQLQQVFEEVIGNAIEYRRPGSVAAVTLSVKRTAEGEECLVTIADNGTGIPADFQSSIFLPLKRLHGREIPGAGLGLAISKRIVEAHSGRMWVESEPGTGACFCFTLRPFGIPHDGPLDSGHLTKRAAQ